MGEAGEIAGRDQGACWVSSVRKFDTLALDLALKGHGFSRAGKVPKKKVFLMLFSCERSSDHGVRARSGGALMGATVRLGGARLQACISQPI